MNVGSSTFYRELVYLQGIEYTKRVIVCIPVKGEVNITLNRIVRHVGERVFIYSFSIDNRSHWRADHAGRTVVLAVPVLYI